MDSDLRTVIDAWEMLPVGLKNAILAIVVSAQADK